MNLEADKLKKFYQAYVASIIPADRKSCPSPRAIHKMIMFSSRLRRKKMLIDHISKCSYCKDEFFFLLDLKRYEDIMITEMKFASKPALSPDNSINFISSHSFFMKYATIFISITLIAMSIIQFRQKEDYTRVQRRRDSVIKLINPMNEFYLHPPLIFRWRKYSNAEYYVLELFDDALLPVWTSPKIGGLGCYLPEEIFSSLKHNRRYFWMITAFSDLEKISESSLESFFTVVK